MRGGYSLAFRNLLGDTDAQSVGLLDVHVIGIVFALQVGPLLRLVLDDELQDALRTASLGLAALAALRLQSVGQNACI